MKLYGIPNCDTVKKARKWLDTNDIAHDFHDYKKAGAEQNTLEKACELFGWETVLNKRGTTWRKLDDATKETITNAPSAIALMMEQPSMIKRPLADNGNIMLIGFSEKEWEESIRS